MASAKGLQQVGYYDSIGGGQVVVENGIAYIAHMRAPHGTSVVDVRDPKNCKELATLDMPAGTHSHKVRVGNGLMVVNRELNRVDPGPVPDGWQGGIGIFDISTPSKPRLITEWKTSAGTGVHRFDFDGRYVYMSPTEKGFVGNFMMIMDLKDPARPTEVGRWWMPGQWTAGGEKPSWDKTEHRCHHPLRMGNRLYTSYWLAGFVILDIEDMTKPRFVSGLDWSPPFACPTHTALPLPYELNGRRYMVVADEDVFRTEKDPCAFMWMVDITDERNPVPVSSFQVEGFQGTGWPTMTTCHQPCEKVTGTEIPFAWFAQGLRIIDIGNPQAPREVAHYLPDPPAGLDRLSSNDITVDERGLLYLLDRRRGLHIVERI